MTAAVRPAGPTPLPDSGSQRIDPARSACVLIGVDKYPGGKGLAPLRSVRHNLIELRAALTDRSVWGIPEDRIVTVSNPRTSADICDPIRVAAQQAMDTLLVYYAGHGLLDRDDSRLCLTLPGSSEDKPETCVDAGYVRRAMKGNGAAMRRVLILDCCFSGKVLQMSPTGTVAADLGVRAAVKTLRDIKGSYVMTSATHDRPSHAPDPDECSAFTGELVDVLRKGIPDGPEMLGLHAVFREVRDRVVERDDLPTPQEPQDESQNGVGDLEFVRNLAVLPPLLAPDPLAPAPRGRRWPWAVVAGALGLGIGFAAMPAVDRWQEHTREPVPATGQCATGAFLLDHSDVLNKQEADGEKLAGLSGLALLPGGNGEALALADNEFNRVFPLRLGPSGSADTLEPSARTATTLRPAPGGRLPAWMDAEALVVEKGGRTILVAAETGPAIRRFDLATGRQIGADLPVPKEFKPWPVGGAQTGRTIEALALSPDGRHLYAGMEASLSQDGDSRGRNLLRIQRYKGTPGGTYVPDRQYAYRAADGLYLTELVAVGADQLLALERQYAVGIGNAVRVQRLSLTGAQDVTGEQALFRRPADEFVRSEKLFDLAECPPGDPGQVATKGPQANPLLQNAEGMALGEPWTTGKRKGWRPLYLVSDDNLNEVQITRFYLLAVRV
ncbi:esterase-like activity of phytase family protein [Streptomyces sp. ISL-99]|uniref:caspase, EACC1-associated type n=1 Tax=Streptomyces sp. ISL-99 TaxID=2819193 RepID=UPI001BE96522|nr:esterase-like activity of phytase family protein [Streptomyces sp. ISL-99]MBT2527711.1 esterase-like activity of phytase family protein [Streptomyces sp. ISL-99]